MNSVRDNIAAGIYNTQLPYPSREPKPRLAATATSKDVRAYADQLAAWEAAAGDIREARRVYNDDVNRLMELFRRDLLTELGLLDHPKALVLYNKAWDRGHGSGLNEVLQEAEDLSDLLI